MKCETPAVKDECSRAKYPGELTNEIEDNKLSKWTLSHVYAGNGGPDQTEHLRFCNFGPSLPAHLRSLVRVFVFR